MTLVSVIIPAVRWDERLSRTVETILAQELPAETEIEIAIALADGDVPPGVDPRVIAVANPGGSIPSGLNRALNATTGDFVVRVDSRCELPSSYLTRMLARLEEPTTGCVGAGTLVLDRGLFGSTYAIAFNGGLLGPSPYRYRRTSGEVDTAYLGAWRRETLLVVGGFDERMVRNQDNELAQRIRGHGMTVWYEADAVVGYWNDRDLKRAVIHHRDFGRWRMVQASQGQEALTASQRKQVAVAGLGAAVFVAALSDARARRVAATIAGVGYLAAGAVATSYATRIRRTRPDLADPEFHPAAPLLAPALAVIIDAAWAWGILEPVLKRRSD